MVHNAEMLSGQHYCDGCFTVPPRFDFKVLPLKGRKITVISLIGECDTLFGNRQCHNVEGYPGEEFLSQVSPGTYIDGYYDCERQIVYLMFHPMKLEEIVHSIRDEKLKMDDMLSMNDYINLKLLYYLFIVSHIVVVFSVGSGLDPTYIRVFKLIDKMRAKMRHTLDGYLRNLPLPRDWLNAGRASIPKLLFVFKLLPNVARKICTTPEAVRSLEQNLVTQIFNTFYETGITSNNPANQLFILPGHNFVHVLLGNEYPNGIGQKPVMHDDLAQEYFELILDNLNMNHLKSIKASFSERNSAVPPPTPWDFPPPDQPEEHSLAAFLHLHVTAMLDQTVNRTVGFGQVPLAYELPTCKAWFMACYKLYTSLMPEDTLNTELNSDLIPDMADGASLTPNSLAEAWHRALGTLVSTSAVRSSGLTDPFSQELVTARNKGNPRCGWIQSYPTDPLYRLSELRCRAAMTAAEAHYKQDLPIHYSNTYHVVKVVSAFNVLISLARGRLVFQALMQLSKRLAHLYLAGRVTCSALSLTGHPCQHELHRVPDEAANLRALLASLPSGGETKTDVGDREGFFSSRLSATEREVKAGLENVLPSAGTEILASQCSTIESSSSSSGQLLGEGVDEEDTENPLISRRRIPTRQDTTRSKTTSPRTGVSIPEPNAPVMCTVRFRDGVPASSWQTGDIPRFPSWSIYALGKYFSYSHSSGLSCCGFLRSSNFLLPWDVTINPNAWASNERAGRAPKGGARGGKYRGGKSDVDTVKLFIGFEMECPMGHRFFLAGPDRPMDGPMQSSQVRRAVHGLLTRDLPLFIPCRCQNSQIRGGSGGLQRAASSASEWSTGAPTSDGRPVIWAQLSRIYLAIPAAPIQVRLQPRVRPGPSKTTPIFHLGHTLDQCNEGLIEDKFSDSDRNNSTDDESDGHDADGLTDSRTLEYHKPLFRATSSGTSRSKQHPGFILLDNGFAYHDGTQLFTRPTNPDEIKEWKLLKGCIKLQV
ncbi:hypothetical protein AHF37_00306 [Paragonimus kellicotti]|nr:hypothetical protein AHF37_00306 [Paragonimus kellicotti]